MEKLERSGHPPAPSAALVDRPRVDLSTSDDQERCDLMSAAHKYAAVTLSVPMIKIGRCGRAVRQVPVMPIAGFVTKCRDGRIRIARRRPASLVDVDPDR
jgi:hypothetical protein